MPEFEVALLNTIRKQARKKKELQARREGATCTTNLELEREFALALKSNDGAGVSEKSGKKEESGKFKV